MTFCGQTQERAGSRERFEFKVGGRGGGGGGGATSKGKSGNAFGSSCKPYLVQVRIVLGGSPRK